MSAESLRTVAVNLSFATKSSLEFLLKLSVFELNNIYLETKKVANELEKGAKNGK